MTQEREVIAPASIPQEIFINSDADITIASGSAGSSKSYSILMRWFRYVNCPHSRGVVFRRTSTQLTAQGGLWDDAKSLFGKVYGKHLKISIKHMKLTFPSGASLQFSHYENEAAKEKFKGLQADYIAFDEATEFTEEMITYLMSRNRNAEAELDHKACMVMATNPHCDSFLRTWLETGGWLDPITGIPIPERRGVVRWFYKNRDGSMDWYDTKEEAEAVYGVGDDSGVKSMCVIGSTVYDNPYISKAYVGNLKTLSRVEQDRLLYGSWFAKEEAGGYFKESWITKVRHPNSKATVRVRGWDLAASLPTETYKDPDYTAGVLMSKDKDKVYTVEDVVRFRDRFMGVEKRILETAIEDGTDVTILLPLDAGASGQSYARTLQAKLAEHGFTVNLVKPKTDKVTRFGAFSSMCEAGFVNVVDADWNKDYFYELENFDGGRKGHDDMCDASSDTFNRLIRVTALPSFSIASFTTTNQFRRDF